MNHRLDVLIASLCVATILSPILISLVLGLWKAIELAWAWQQAHS